MESTVLMKAFRLLETMASEQGERSLAELAQLSQLTKPTAHRILRSLASMGYVNHGGGGRYRLGDRLIRIVLGREQERLITAARPILIDLRDVTGETVNLGVLRQNQVAYLLSLESTRPLRRVAGANESHPFHSTALGRAIVAFLPAEQQQQLLAHVALERRTPHSVATRAALATVLSDTLARGYSIDENETDLGVTCVGAPVFSGEPGAVIAAISISAPSSRISASTREELVHALREASSRLSKELSTRQEPVSA